MKINRYIYIAVIFISLNSCASLMAQEQTLTIRQFLEKAVKTDTAFAEILIDSLYLQYNKTLKLPARDWMLSLLGQYNFITDTAKTKPEGTVSLDKLFPQTATKLAISYKGSLASDYASNNSRLDVSLSQSIAANAFGKVYKFQDKIIGIENEVAAYQIVEAYEDYMAYIITSYYLWYEACQNLEIGRSSYKENLKLLDNIKERKKSKIALDIDVNKIHLQVLAKEKKLITLEAAKENALNTIKTIIRTENVEGLVPLSPDLYQVDATTMENQIIRKDIITKSRTVEILKMLEAKSTLDVKRYAGELLPTVDFILGYRLEGADLDFQESDSLVYAGFKVEYPFSNSQGTAKHRVALLEEQKALLTTDSIYFTLSNQVQNVLLKIKQEQKLLEISKSSKDLLELIVADESQNYIFGKVTLNDYIAAVNKLDDARFDCINHLMQLKQLNITYLRLTDKLVRKKDIIS